MTIGVVAGGVESSAARARFAWGFDLCSWCDVRARPVKTAIGSALCWTQYVALLPTARQPATAAATAPGRAPASGVGSTVR